MNLFKKDLFWYGLYLVAALIGIWFLTKLWVPEGFVIAGHDSGLALNSGEFLKTRFFAWDDRIDFGSDNSPHFGSIIMHSFDYLISLLAGVSYAGSQLAVFLWIGGIFIFSFIFSYSLKEKLGKYFVILFPIFLTFNFFILQSIFILERAKYEIIFSTLIFLTLVVKIFLNDKPNILKYSIISSLAISVFNGGGWFGLPLYGGLLVMSFTAILFMVVFSFKEKNFSNLKKILLFYLFNFIFFILLNAYSIFPYLATLLSSDFAKVISQGTISAGYEWLNYISRGSSFLNLFRFQGIPDWYLTGYGVNSDHAYAGLYLTNIKYVFISFLIPILAFLGLLLPSKDKKEKYIVMFFILLLLVSMFFASGTNSPLGFLYEFFYTRIPGFNIFRSPYYKFAPAYLIALSFLLSYSLSKLIILIQKQKVFRFVLAILIIVGWGSYHKVIFSSKDIFTWQPNKSTLVQIPDYVNEFGTWINESDIGGRILVVPSFDKTWRDDSYNWGYWSLSPIPSLFSENANFVANDISIYSGEEGWVNELYSLIALRDMNNFLEIAKRLDIKYIFLKEDYLTTSNFVSIDWLFKDDHFVLVKKFGQWSIFSINDIDNLNMFRLTENIFSIPKEQQYFINQIHNESYDKSSWIDIKNANDNLKEIVKKKFYPLNCESCQIENLGKYADIPAVRILPNSPLYQVKQKRNNQNIIDAKDDQAKIGVYLGLIMIKFSEVRSMYELKIEKQFIDKGLNDINEYLQTITDIITKTSGGSTNFYIASRIYETINPLQKFFRDYINGPDFSYEESFIKDDILKVLWQGVSLKKLFDPIIKQEEKWSYEKYYDLSLLPESLYSLLIDNQTLPVNLQGEKIKPDKIIIDDDNKEFKLESAIDNGRFLTTTTEFVGDTAGVRLYFSNLPDLFQLKRGEVMDFPEGTRGCLKGGLNNFNNSRMYRFKISSTKDVDNFRFYIKENDRKILDNGFLRGDIEIDITAGLDQRPFEYIYAPNTSSNNPQIFLCRRDGSIPQTAKITVKEIYSPIVYAVNDISDINNEIQPMSYTKDNPTQYSINIDELSKDFVLVYNSRFNDLWELYDKDTKKIVTNHFLVDGYANGWMINKGNSRNLQLIYKPQAWYEKGRIISIISILSLLVTFSYISYFKKYKND